jgi:hypothetical protein
VVFSVWVLPWVGPNISWALVAVSAVMMAFSIAMLALTAFKDPGFVPRSPPNEDVEYGMLPATKDHQINGYTVTTKYCPTCRCGTRQYEGCQQGGCQPRGWWPQVTQPAQANRATCL